MVSIGLIDEGKKGASDDALCVQNLLCSAFNLNHTNFKKIFKNFSGDKLEAGKFFKRLKVEAPRQDLIIFIRDLDGLPSNVGQIKLRQEWFKKCQNELQQSSIFILCIWSLEALILADSEGFNNFFKDASLNFNGNPMYQENPKKFLKNHSNNYHESKNPELFKKLDFYKLSKVKFFDDFLKEFESMVAPFGVIRTS